MIGGEIVDRGDAPPDLEEEVSDSQFDDPVDDAPVEDHVRTVARLSLDELEVQPSVA